MGKKLNVKVVQCLSKNLLYFKGNLNIKSLRGDDTESLVKSDTKFQFTRDFIFAKSSLH